MKDSEDLPEILELEDNYFFLENPDEPAVTPVDERDPYTWIERNGGYIADALAVSRGPLGIAQAIVYLAVPPEERSTFFGRSGEDQTGFTWVPNLLNGLSDGADGWFARKVAHELRNQKGPKLDEWWDKFSQNVRRGALLIKGEIDTYDFAVPIARDGLVNSARKVYSALGVEGADKAKWSGKAKTNIMEIALGLSSIQISHTHPEFTRAVHRIGTVASVLSGVQTMIALEQKYQEVTWYDYPNLSKSELFVNSVGRTILYLAGKNPARVLLHDIPYDE